MWPCDPVPRYTQKESPPAQTNLARESRNIPLSALKPVTDLCPLPSIDNALAQLQERELMPEIHRSELRRKVLDPKLWLLTRGHHTLNLMDELPYIPRPCSGREGGEGLLGESTGWQGQALADTLERMPGE